MEEFQYTSQAQEVIFGDGILKRLPDHLEKFGWKRVMLVTSPHFKKSGKLDDVSRLVGNKLLGIFSETKAHVPESQLKQCKEIAKVNNVDVIIGLGGGSTIGLAKAIAFELQMPNQDAAPEASLNVALQARIPTIAIPTTYSGTEMTPIYGVTRPQADGSTRKVTVKDHRVTPLLTIYDPKLTLDLPKELTATTGINALAHCIEAVYSTTRHPLSTASALLGIKYIINSLVSVYRDPDFLEARGHMLMGAHLAGKSLSSAALGVHHGTCHAIGGTAGVPHGVANAIMLPHAIDFNIDAVANHIAEAGEAMGIHRNGKSDEDMAGETAQFIYDYISVLNVPQTLQDAGVERYQLPKIAENMLKSKAVLSNPKPVESLEVAMSLLEAAW